MRRLLPVLILLQVLVLPGACNKDNGQPEHKPSGGGTIIDDPPFTGDVVLTVATCNVLKPSGRRDEMSLEKDIVRQTLVSSIEGTGADLIAFNELDENYIPDGDYSLESLCTGLRGFKWKLQWPNKIHSLGRLTYSYANGFAYNSTKLRLEESSYVWLSKTADKWYEDPLQAYGKVGSPERTCIRARFTHIASGRVFWFFVSHLPTEKQGGAENMAAVVNHFASETAGDLPAILAGDMNFGPGKEPYEVLTSYWTDGNEALWGTLSGSSASYYYTVSVFTTNHPERRIDHIMTRGCTPTNYHTVVRTYTLGGKAWCPSDHLPVLATVTL